MSNNQAQPNDETSSAYARVFTATSSAPVSAKAIANVTGLPYSTVTDQLRKLAEHGKVTSTKDGSRTMWTRADDAQAPTGEQSKPATDKPKRERKTRAKAAEVVEPVAAVEPVSASSGEPLALGTMNKAQLFDVAQSLGLEPPKSATKPKLIEAITAKRRSDANAAAPADQLDAAGAPDGDDAQTPAPDAQSDVDAPAAPDGPWGTPDAHDAPEGSLDAVLADMQSARPVSAPPAQAPRPRRAASPDRPSGGIVASGAARAWARGELERTLLDILQATPDLPHSATSIVKGWNEGRSGDQPVAQPGSVAFALDAMVKKGTARLTQDKPKRYAAVQPALTA